MLVARPCIDTLDVGAVRRQHGLQIVPHARVVDSRNQGLQVAHQPSPCTYGKAQADVVFAVHSARTDETRTRSAHISTSFQQSPSWNQVIPWALADDQANAGSLCDAAIGLAAPDVQPPGGAWLGIANDVCLLQATHTLLPLRSDEVGQANLRTGRFLQLKSARSSRQRCGESLALGR